MQELDYYSIKDRMSNSNLSLFETSPLLYYNKIVLGKDEDDNNKVSKSMEDGKLIHAFIEKPDDFVIADVDKIDGMMGKFIEEVVRQEKRFDDGNQYSIAHEYSGFKNSLEVVLKNFEKPENKKYYEYLKTTKSSANVISSSTKKTLNNCVYSLQNNKLICDLLFTKELFWDVFNEEEIYWDYEVEKDVFIPCKSKLDKIIVDYDRKTITIIDLKTTGNSIYGEFQKINNTNVIDIDYYSTGFFATNFLKYSLYRQAAFYSQAILKWIVTLDGVKNVDFTDYQLQYYIIPVETKFPYESCIYNISDRVIQYGHNKINQLMKEYLWCKENQIWKKKKYYMNILEVS